MALQSHPGEKQFLACPFFMPTHKYDSGTWIHPARLPLAAGWKGECAAPGHEGEIPDDERLREHCNLGYVKCPNCPSDRAWDSVRFTVVREGERHLTLRYVCERDHRPSEDGWLEYDAGLERWPFPHPDPRIQRKAECYLDAYRARRRGPEAE
jgi:hypothetical protein